MANGDRGQMVQGDAYARMLLHVFADAISSSDTSDRFREISMLFGGTFCLLAVPLSLRASSTLTQRLGFLPGAWTKRHLVHPPLSGGARPEAMCLKGSRVGHGGICRGRGLGGHRADAILCSHGGVFWPIFCTLLFLVRDGGWYRYTTNYFTCSCRGGS